MAEIPESLKRAWQQKNKTQNAEQRLSADTPILETYEGLAGESSKIPAAQSAQAKPVTITQKIKNSPVPSVLPLFPKISAAPRTINLGTYEPNTDR
jgi:hypothetical protein